MLGTVRGTHFIHVYQLVSDRSTIVRQISSSCCADLLADRKMIEEEPSRPAPSRMSKVKGDNLEQRVIWNSQAKSGVSHKLHPLFLVCIVTREGGVWQ